MFLVEKQFKEIKIVSTWQMQNILHCGAYVHSSVTYGITVTANKYEIFILNSTVIRYILNTLTIPFLQFCIFKIII